MVRAASGRLIRQEEEWSKEVSPEGREKVTDPYDHMLKQMLVVSVGNIKEACRQFEDFEDVLDFLYFQTPDGSEPATHERRSNRKELLETACNTIDWIRSTAEEGDSGTLTFVEVCRGLGICPEISREIVFENLTSTCLTHEALKKLSMFLEEVSAERDEEEGEDDSAFVEVGTNLHTVV